MIKKEWQRLLHNPLLIVVLMAIILIPSIYAGLFLASMWDPYGELDKLPVAVWIYGGGYNTANTGGCSLCDCCMGLMCLDCLCDCI